MILPGDIGLGAARDKVRVARSLESLPRLSEAFRAGRVSYSKVRAMTRVATPENEDYLLTIARHGTASHVERLVCNYRKVQRIAERERANTLHEQRSVSFRHDSDGALVIEARLAPETGAIVLEALAAAGEAMYVRRREENSAQVSHPGRKTVSAARGWRKRSPRTRTHPGGLEIVTRSSATRRRAPTPWC